ncbi:MAG: hypothetical protein KA190_06390, partial [Kofleriaceae bacterium]|nr:hypothetical protein [Kofleriaceae bacterium]
PAAGPTPAPTPPGGGPPRTILAWGTQPVAGAARAAAPAPMPAATPMPMPAPAPAPAAAAAPAYQASPMAPTMMADPRQQAQYAPQAPQAAYAAPAAQPMPGGQAPMMNYGGGPAGPGMPAPAYSAAPAPAYPGAAPAAAAGHQVQFQLPGGIKLPINVGGPGAKLKIIGAVILAILLAVGGVLFKKMRTPKGQISYAALGVDKGKPGADDLYKALAKNATKWKKDAIFWSLNYQAVRPDGTVDVSKGAEIVYVSPGNSASKSKRTRSDSVRKYGASATAVKPKKYGWNDPVEGLEAHPAAVCTIKDLMNKLSAEGVIKDKPVRVTFDPKFADFYAWHVISSEPKLDALYSWDNCAVIK